MIGYPTVQRLASYCNQATSAIDEDELQECLEATIEHVELHCGGADRDLMTVPAGLRRATLDIARQLVNARRAPTGAPRPGVEQGPRPIGFLRSRQAAELIEPWARPVIA